MVCQSVVVFLAEIQEGKKKPALNHWFVSGLVLENDTLS